MWHEAGGGGDVITLNGRSITASNFGADSDAWMRLAPDGKAYERKNAGSWVQIDAATDWIIPNGSAGVPYRGQHRNRTGDGFASGTTEPSNDVWNSLAANILWKVLDTDGGPDGKSITFDIRIDDGTTILADESYTIAANRENI